MRFLVTGGSQGIGAAMVEAARQAGHDVVFTGRNDKLLAEVATRTGALRSAFAALRPAKPPPRMTTWGRGSVEPCDSEVSMISVSRTRSWGPGSWDSIVAIVRNLSFVPGAPAGV